MKIATITKSATAAMLVLGFTQIATARQESGDPAMDQCSSLQSIVQEHQRSTAIEEKTRQAHPKMHFVDSFNLNRSRAIELNALLDRMQTAAGREQANESLLRNSRQVLSDYENHRLVQARANFELNRIVPSLNEAMEAEIDRAQAQNQDCALRENMNASPTIGARSVGVK